MTPYYSDDVVTIYHGDCRHVMPELEASSIDTIITDPPYGYEFMGKDWDRGVPGVEFWQAALRVAKPGATLLAFGGTRTFHRLMCAIEDAGWEIRDCMMWVYGSGFPKSLDISKAIDKAAGAQRDVVGKKYEGLGNRRGAGFNHPGGRDGVPVTTPATNLAEQYEGWGTALKPAWEPIIIAMKPLDGTFAENAEKWGVAGLNINGSLVASEGGTRRTNELSQNRRYTGQGGTSFAALPGPRGGGPSGRWPANVVLDEDAAAALDEQSGELTSGVNPARRSPDRSRSIYSGFKGNRECTVRRGSDAGGASRFFYCAKAGVDRGEGNNHPTVKPLDLMKYLCTLTKTPMGGVVLDPFMGSGTTAVAAVLTGRKFVGIEINADYIEIAKRRLAQGTLPL